MEIRRVFCSAFFFLGGGGGLFLFLRSPAISLGFTAFG